MVRFTCQEWHVNNVNSGMSRWIYSVITSGSLALHYFCCFLHHYQDDRFSMKSNKVSSIINHYSEYHHNQDYHHSYHNSLFHLQSQHLGPVVKLAMNLNQTENKYLTKVSVKYLAEVSVKCTRNQK